MTTQQFLSRDVPEASGVVATSDANAARAAQYALRERYTAMIRRFSGAATGAGDRDEVAFAHRRYAKLMAVDGGHHLCAALSLLRQGKQLTGAEVAAIVAGAERGSAICGAIALLIRQPEQLPEPAVAGAIRTYVLASDSPHFWALQRTLQP